MASDSTLSTTHNEVISLADKGQALYCTNSVYGTDYTPAYATEGKLSVPSTYIAQTAFSVMRQLHNVNANGERLQPNAKAGDIRFRISMVMEMMDENDREYCGTGIPKVEANLNLTASYKGLRPRRAFRRMGTWRCSTVTDISTKACRHRDKC